MSEIPSLLQSGVVMEEVNFNFASNIEIHFPYSFLLETIKKNP
jgi:hypothetical protein